jgi:hypothetical protein
MLEAATSRNKTDRALFIAINQENKQYYQ